MHLSSILVYIKPEYFAQTYSQISQYPFLKIYYQCESTGRLVLVQQHNSTEEQIHGLNTIKTTQHVLSADLVYHFIESEQTINQSTIRG